MDRVTSGLALERDELLRRFYGKEAGHDGEFLVGVLTTGVYCLPSCRARAPRPENVRFFGDEAKARGAGLRPCKRCRPDHFYRGFDPDRERIRSLAGAVRAEPQGFADTAALARRAGVGATKLNALFRRNYHLTPADFLTRARVARAKELFAGRRTGVIEAALACGFESPSSFHENFRALTGMTPAAYRELGSSPEFRLVLPRGFQRSELIGIFARDPGGRTERVRGGRLAKTLVLEESLAEVELEFTPHSVLVRLAGPRRLSAAAFRAAHERVVRWLGLESDPAGLERRAARSPEVARLVQGRSGLRVTRSTDLFEGLVWVVVGAQVHVAFAASCRTALIELAGTRAGARCAHPGPAEVARLEVADLERCQFSRRKAEYLLDAARAIASGALDLEGLRTEPVPLVAACLGAVRGLGPWSVQYLCLRSYGFEDCAPIGDVALAEALKRFHDLSERPEADEARRLMEPFAPHRSLTTLHLWKSLSS
jgi:AraC family transcriptional regulator of adaptative response / DNA-3-methyladenine glycosylase II